MKTINFIKTVMFNWGFLVVVFGLFICYSNLENTINESLFYLLGNIITFIGGSKIGQVLAEEY